MQLRVQFSKCQNLHQKAYTINFNDMMKSMANMLKRVYSIERVKDEIERLTMKFVIILIKSKSQKLKYEGMKILFDIFR